MYDENFFFVANPINRYSMSLRTNPKYEADGSLVIHIQNESPGADKASQLAAGAQGQVPPHAAALLARRKHPVDHRRLMGDPAGEESLTTGLRRRFADHAGRRPLGRLTNRFDVRRVWEMVAEEGLEPPTQGL